MLVLITNRTQPLVSMILRVLGDSSKAAAIAAATLLLTFSQVKADELGSFGEDGTYRYHSYSGPGRPSLPDQSQALFDYRQRIQEEADRNAIERNRQAYIDEQRRQSMAPPANQNQYNYPEAVITPNGTMLCQRSFNSTYCN